MSKIETHPFPPFVPSKEKVLILGSFPGKEHTQSKPDEEAWFYGAKRNQFWKILSSVYGEELIDVSSKKSLFEKHGIAITDIFYSLKRLKDSNLDTNLEIAEYNDDAILGILKNDKIKSIFFTSKFVEQQFKKRFPSVSIGEYLPSPSPRYARITLERKIEIYKDKLPK